MNKGSAYFFFLFIVLFVLQHSHAQTKLKYWISFKDKNGSPYSLSSPNAFLTKKAIDRRSRHNVAYHVSDLPVIKAYITGVDTIAHVSYSSKWLNGVLVTVDSAVAKQKINKIKSLPFVLDTTRVKKMRPVIEPFPDLTEQQTAAMHRSAFQTSASAYDFGNSLGQAHQMHVNCLHNDGFRGQGMTIAVMDVGFTNVDSGPVFDSIRNSGGILGGYDFVSGGSNFYQGGSHGTMVFSCLAGNKPGTIIGTAPKASYWLFRTEDGSSETITEEYNWIRAAEFADSVGADIFTTSLGYNLFDIPEQNHSYAMLNGRTAPMSIAATMAARKGIFVLTAAGNEGGSAWKYIIVPADADSICSVGAVDTSGTYAPFSSVGPTADGRIKPDLVATGWGSWICDPSNVCYPGNGTSFATPILAGAAACYWQKNKSLSNMELLKDLKNRASQKNNPDNKLGWGVPDLSSCGWPDLPFSFNTYYDPGKSQLTIELERTNYDYVNILVTDLNGKKIVETGRLETKGLNFYLNAEILANCIYIVRVQTSKGSGHKFLLR